MKPFLRKKPCLDCLAPVKPSSTRCRTCANRYGGAARGAAVSAGLKLKAANDPAYLESVRERARKASASRDPAAMGRVAAESARRIMRAKIAWCPLEYRADYKGNYIHDSLGD